MYLVETSASRYKRDEEKFEKRKGKEILKMLKAYDDDDDIAINKEESAGLARSWGRRASGFPSSE